MRIVVLCLVILTGSCSNYQVDTFAKWCEWITDDDALDRHSPSWAIFPGWSFDADAIRADYASTLNAAYMGKIQNRADKMVWTENKNLHMYSLAAFFVIDESDFQNSWIEPLDRAKSGDFDLDENPEFCLFSTASVLFDEIHIHNLQVDGLGRKLGDDVSVYDNERMERAKSMPSSILNE